MNRIGVKLIAYAGAMATSKNSSFTQLDLGPTGHVVASNIAALREEKGLSYNQLSKVLGKDFAHDIPPIGLRRIEASARKVTVDDLFALAMAFEVSPARILMNEYPEPAVATAVPDGVDRTELQAWVEGRLASFSLVDLQSYYDREIGETAFALRLSKHRLKRLERGRTEMPDLLDYDQHIRIVTKVILAREGLLQDLEEKFKAVSRALNESRPAHEIDEEEWNEMSGFIEKFNELMNYEDE